MQPERIPVIVGAGEITHRTKDPAEGLEPIALMERALREAERDAGAALLSFRTGVTPVEGAPPPGPPQARERAQRARTGRNRIAG